MSVQNFSNYSKLYEAKLAECEFFIEENISVNDIINPLEDLITEEFIGKWLKDKWEKGKQVAKDVYTNVKDALSKAFDSVVSFFKNFSIKKLLGSIWNKIKEIGSKVWNKIKEALSGFKEFIVSNGLCDQNNKPDFKRIWDVICSKAKGIVNWGKEGVSTDDLKKVGSQVKINEADAYDIGDDEVKYYGFFEKVAHALGIKNARFNGVVSQIMKKGTYGVIILGLIKAAGMLFPALATFGGGMALGPVAMAAIGGMLLMAGLIILSIWVCKPYPTVDDCLAYLHTAFSGNLERTGMVNIFITDVDIVYSQNTTIINYTDSDDSDESSQGSSQESSVDISVDDAKPLKTMYPTMIKNLKALQSMIISFEGVGFEGESEDTSDILKSVTANNKEELEKLKKRKTVKESILPFSIFEKELSKQPRRVRISKEEEYLTQAFNNITKSLKSLKDDKDKGIGITDEFIGEILDKKMDSEAKDAIKSLYKEVYEHLYGKYSKTISDFGPLYKESVEVISDKNKRKVTAEKIARLAKRSLQFEGENMYSALGEFGADMKEFNSTLKEIMASFKAEEEGVVESFKHISSFLRYNNK